MFEVGGRYANRKGFYTVLSITYPMMTVRYDDGSEAELRMSIQERIWENIVGEMEASALRAERRQKRSTPGGHFFIKTVDTIAEDELDVPSLKEKLAIIDREDLPVRSGDRLLFYFVELQAVLAVATIISEKETVKAALYNITSVNEITIYPLDLDAYAPKLTTGVPLEDLGIESVPNIRDRLRLPGVYVEITEDEFEVIAETLTEEVEEDEEDLDQMVDDDDDLEDEL